MARYKGAFSVAANYEPLVGGPFDARQLVEAKADLINPTTWRHASGDEWVYVGMIVSVASDVDSEKNGVYRLSALPYTEEANWIKQAEAADISDLQAQIDNLEVSGGGSLDVEVETESELPEIGNSNTTYYVNDNKSIYRWQEEAQSYVSYGGGIADLDINIIYGGNANGDTTD